MRIKSPVSGNPGFDLRNCRFETVKLLLFNLYQPPKKYRSIKLNIQLRFRNSQINTAAATTAIVRPFYIDILHDWQHAILTVANHDSTGMSETTSWRNWSAPSWPFSSGQMWWQPSISSCSFQGLRNHLVEKLEQFNNNELQKATWHSGQKY